MPLITSVSVGAIIRIQSGELVSRSTLSEPAVEAVMVSRGSRMAGPDGTESRRYDIEHSVGIMKKDQSVFTGSSYMRPPCVPSCICHFRHFEAADHLRVYALMQSRSGRCHLATCLITCCLPWLTDALGSRRSAMPSGGPDKRRAKIGQRRVGASLGLPILQKCIHCFVRLR